MPSSLYRDMYAVYSEWYYSRTGVKHLMDGIDGKHLKQLINKLRKLTKNDEILKRGFGDDSYALGGARAFLS